MVSVPSSQRTSMNSAPTTAIAPTRATAGNRTASAIFATRAAGPAGGVGPGAPVVRAGPVRVAVVRVAVVLVAGAGVGPTDAGRVAWCAGGLTSTAGPADALCVDGETRSNHRGEEGLCSLPSYYV